MGPGKCIEKSHGGELKIHEKWFDLSKFDVQDTEIPLYY